MSLSYCLELTYMFDVTLQTAEVNISFSKQQWEWWNFEDGAYTCWLLRWLPELLFRLLRWWGSVQRHLRGRIWSPVRGHGEMWAWGERWYLCGWQLLDLLSCLCLQCSHCCHLMHTSWLCAFPLCMPGWEEMFFVGCSGYTTAGTQIWQHHMHPFVARHLKDMTGLVCPRDFCRWQGCLCAMGTAVQADVRCFKQLGKLVDSCIIFATLLNVQLETSIIMNCIGKGLSIKVCS